MHPTSLTGIDDETGNTTWTYNEYGEVTLKSQNHVAGGALTRSVASTYQNARLTRLDYPSGAAVDYVWSQGRVTEIKLNGVALLKDIRYRADGQPLGWTWGNERAYTRSFDSETGWLNGHPLGSDTRTLETDLAGRITSTLHALKPANDQVYGYDDLDRLTNQSNQQGSTAWLYDPNGNRTLHQSGVKDYAYAIAPDSNRLLSMAGPIAKSFEYDATGNILSDGTYGFTYNEFGRLSKLTRLSKSTTYRYNALGERVQKEGQGASNGPVRFVYDDAHRLLGEYDKSGNRQQETVWLGDLPVAALTPAGTLYVHADHLNAPRVLMDANDRAVWRWDSDAFGVGAAQEDPDADKRKVVYNLRLPGQYFDSESGLHYNLFRDYDPRSGRYVQSDPIGLAGGVNLYGYVYGNPVRYTDPTGEIAPIVAGTIIGAISGGYGAAIQGGDFGQIAVGTLAGAGTGALFGVVGGPLLSTAGRALTGLARAVAGAVSNVAGQGVLFDECHPMNPMAPIGAALGAGTIGFGNQLLTGAAISQGAISGGVGGRLLVGVPNALRQGTLAAGISMTGMQKKPCTCK